MTKAHLFGRDRTMPVIPSNHHLLGDKAGRPGKAYHLKIAVFNPSQQCGKVTSEGHMLRGREKT